MRFGVVVGNGSLDKFWKMILDITPLTNFMNIFVKKKFSYFFVGIGFFLQI